MSAQRPPTPRRDRKQDRDLSALKPGSSQDDARQVAGKDDFGAPADDVNARTYTSGNTRRSEPGAAQARSSDEPDGRRNAGAGAPASGPGSSSGGDLDPAFTGVAGGTGMAGSVDKHHHPDAADTDGSSDEMASGSHAAGANQTHVGKVGGGSPVQGHTQPVQPDDRTAGPQGADAASHDDGLPGDAFHGEVSSSEATGRNNAGD